MSNQTTPPSALDPWPAGFVPVVTAKGRRIHAVALAGPWARRVEHGLTEVLCCLVGDDQIEILEVDDRRASVCRICAREIERHERLGIGR